jgi:hypothetical protein
MAFEPSERMQIILAASIVAGASATDEDVRRHTERLAGYLNEGSAPMSVFNDIDVRDRNTSQIKQFPATVIGIDKEVTSTRAVVMLHTRPSQWHVNGQEVVRTERTDTPAGRAAAERLQSLIGHRVFLTVAVERGGGGNTRVIRSVQDHGADADYDSARPEWVFDYSALDDRLLRRLESRRAADS